MNYFSVNKSYFSPNQRVHFVLVSTPTIYAKGCIFEGSLMYTYHSATLRENFVPEQGSCIHSLCGTKSAFPSGLLLTFTSKGIWIQGPSDARVRISRRISYWSWDYHISERHCCENFSLQNLKRGTLLESRAKLYSAKIRLETENIYYQASREKVVRCCSSRCRFIL